ncbi:MAG: ribosome recycling factor [Clostridiaceae bacterium]|jgi:ribosome recycling factor|nr:ribosome recycling factor [Clostridiaceae bacterium]
MAPTDIHEQTLNVYEGKMEKSIAILEADLRTIRAGRANPHVLDSIVVPYYGVPTPLQQVANIQIPEAKMLIITPWDSSMLKEIERAIQASDIGINPMNDGRCLRLAFPAMTEERRRDLTRDVTKKGEESKISVRNIRREANDHFKALLKDKEISEDVNFSLGEAIQKLTDTYIEKVDDTIELKTTEIMEI